MKESISLFGSIRNMSYFVKTAIILFLNKRDLFEQKLQRTPLTVCFPEYTGSQDYQEAAAYIVQQYEVINDSSNQPTYSHLTCATDTSNVQFVFDSAVDVIVASNLSKSGIA